MGDKSVDKKKNTNHAEIYDKEFSRADDIHVLVAVLVLHLSH